ncbi:bifunctional diaminohydroxyphosphoribosylaminopyrimidine deaminase/5-amino-6-(5-phosphoribosylamino)uracil reductase RibD [Salegentibacter mishustinae]|uniref:Riboflavin biosynthesis protein RibD n=1 Tax=Salegentibacter mishustinae TaxID=270918 RepID=A0A0Q9Z9X8_9FLAO|nr:bifunctional diaminohydroxyphosphoribosylaminopyrimidine deaminase/5-amino-6-(5-phosphoribosylamino)uracil reductase RibD [Salegentibacter mishustinae]KRG28905.1 riboflavin biosynthesis protein RibD [Salegentibacter mishustinae]PNW22045.1 riboflavin biosynthesis protein RibD [Salegentibacter mishustinae]PZX65404.1 diaminohydroxyphosphoribosylaminopyrimidine deaminase [Salegentibacter mishustinae]GGW85272.1 riboflavin biosynthesis protein RibD [Salegentibacter mishustinae]
MNIHEKYIKRCIELAKNGLGATYPNPLVGSVIVHKNSIIGEGWHQKAGAPHAEVNAVNSVKDKSLLKKSTIYVSLEPCSHFGKTPPCSDLIIAKGIKKVVIGAVDPFAEVAGRGIKKLMEAGCEVQVGVLEQECQDLNKRFFTFHQKKRPYIILKWAQTADGFIAPKIQEKREPVWITNQYSKQLVHKWRSEEQAILVGTNTAIADNPKLNTRLWKGENPVRAVIDKKLKIPEESALFDGTIKTIVLTENEKKSDNNNLAFEKLDFQQDLPNQICEVLYRHNLQSVIIEGGAKTLQTFTDNNLWDEARVFTGISEFHKGVKAPEFSGKMFSKTTLERDTLKFYKND